MGISRACLVQETLAMMEAVRIQKLPLARSWAFALEGIRIKVAEAARRKGSGHLLNLSKVLLRHSSIMSAVATPSSGKEETVYTVIRYNL